VTSETVLRLEGISKRFGPLLANDAISIDLKRGEIVALLGENGAGKTTLMNILFGHYTADAGSIEVFGKTLPAGEPRAAIAAGIGMVHQHFTLAENLSVLDNIMLGTEHLWRLSSDRAGARRKIAKLSSSFGLAVEPDAPIGALSVGERQRVEILKALYRDARILILDEPTAVLTPQESANLFATLKQLTADGLSIIFISHKLNEVMTASDRIYVLRAGRIVAERQKTMTNRQELAELMVGRPVPEPKAEKQARGPVQVALADVVAKGLDHVTLTIHGGEIVGLAGVSGNGQSELADLLSGLQVPSHGTVELFGSAVTPWTPHHVSALGVGRIPEDRHKTGLITGMSALENAVTERYRDKPFSRASLFDWPAVTRFTEKIIADYDVKCPSPQADVRTMSGGNMQKLILGRVLSSNPRFILACQPVRGLDVGAIAYVHAQLIAARKGGASILLISDDLDEILGLSDRVAVMYRGQISAPIEREKASVEALGLLMAGHGFAHGAQSHAA
jgi:simple sugar transport system ATP-binding protein